MAPDHAACDEAQDRERIERSYARICHTRQPIAAIGAAELTAVSTGG
jgi:hypothetical protein